MRGRLWRGWLACAGLVTIGALACNEVGTNPSSPISITFLPPPLPSLTVGDSLRDSTGKAVPLRAIAFNARNDTIPDAPVRYLALDAARRVALDSVTGDIVGKDTGEVKVVASVGALQTQPLKIAVVLPPTDLVRDGKEVDTLDYTLGLSGRDTTLALSVKLVHAQGSDAIPVPSYVVRWAFEYPEGFTNQDTTRIQLVDPNKKGSLVDTTKPDGTSSRSLRITPFVPAGSDSVVLLVSAARPNATPVSGSPVRFVVHYSIK